MKGESFWGVWFYIVSVVLGGVCCLGFCLLLDGLGEGEDLEGLKGGEEYDHIFKFKGCLK